MAKNYDGWTVKNSITHTPWLIPNFCRKRRTETIKAVKEEWGDFWRKERRKGWLKIVKVKLVEVK
ncbi:unnamed protein product [marine sediment metagenome]|uniref:Uncharacterized protein n=1 Tax=marine sediment metagenome TaxID=412755 RepID=X1CLU0_9ZZZZ